jgi:four helix bundle protein
MAKGSYGRSKAARRADSESYLTVLPTPEMPYETESADQAYLRQATGISVAANIAEGAERGSDRDFVRFLKIADGSNAETQALTLIAGDAGILNAQQVTEIVNHTHQIGRMLNNLMHRCCG